jgi:hypothetical protein
VDLDKVQVERCHPQCGPLDKEVDEVDKEGRQVVFARLWDYALSKRRANHLL